ncbi:glycosyltransferase family 4 protein [Thermovorax subterraneus]|nr:glycosyltransferase family 4 protein [Thermovorax subterraneus]
MKGKLKIIMLSTDYLPNIGGVAAHIFNLTNALQKMGHEICVVNPIQGQEWKINLTIENGVQVCRLVYPFDEKKLNRFLNRIKITVKGINQVIKTLGGVDIIHQHDYIGLNLAILMQRKNRTSLIKPKWIWTNHTSQFVKDYKKVIKRQFLKIAYKGVDGIITVSREIENMTKEIFKEKPVCYIPNGVDIERFNPYINVERKKYGLSDEDFVILCPRRMVEKNGIIYLAYAVHKLINKYPSIKWKFVFMGDEPSINTDKNYIRTVKDVLTEPYNKGYVKYLGNVPMEKMPEINALADIVVIPSLIEAVSLSALEALASGKPVIATDVGGLPEIIFHNNTGILVPPREPEAIAVALERLYFDDVARRRLAMNGTDMVSKKYSWSSIAQMTEEFYKTLLLKNQI